MNLTLAYATLTITTLNSTYSITVNPWGTSITGGIMGDGDTYAADPIVNLRSTGQVDLLAYWGEVVDSRDVRAADADWSHAVGETLTVEYVNERTHTHGTLRTSRIESVRWDVSGGQ